MYADTIINNNDLFETHTEYVQYVFIKSNSTVWTKIKFDLWGTLRKQEKHFSVCPS